MKSNKDIQNESEKGTNIGQYDNDIPNDQARIKIGSRFYDGFSGRFILERAIKGEVILQTEALSDEGRSFYSTSINLDEKSSGKFYDALKRKAKEIATHLKHGGIKSYEIINGWKQAIISSPYRESSKEISWRPICEEELNFFKASLENCLRK